MAHPAGGPPPIPKEFGGEYQIPEIPRDAHPGEAMATIGNMFLRYMHVTRGSVPEEEAPHTAEIAEGIRNGIATGLAMFGRAQSVPSQEDSV